MMLCSHCRGELTGHPNEVFDLNGRGWCERCVSDGQVPQPKRHVSKREDLDSIQRAFIESGHRGILIKDSRIVRVEE